MRHLQDQELQHVNWIQHRFFFRHICVITWFTSFNELGAKITQPANVNLLVTKSDENVCQSCCLLFFPLLSSTIMKTREKCNYFSMILNHSSSTSGVSLRRGFAFEQIMQDVEWNIGENRVNAFIRWCFLCFSQSW